MKSVYLIYLLENNELINVITLIAIAGHIGSNGQPHGLSILVSALVATANGINCNNGLAAVTSSHIGLVYWSSL